MKRSSMLQSKHRYIVQPSAAAKNNGERTVYFPVMGKLFFIALVGCIVFGFQIHAQTYTENKCSNGRVYTSSDYETVAFGGAKAFDGVLTNPWVSGAGTSTTNNWIAYIFNTPKRITKIDVHPRWGFGGATLTNLAIEASNNSTNGQNGTWTVLASNLTIPDTEQWHEFIISNTTAYTSYRLSGGGVPLAGGYYSNFAEIQMRESVSSTTPPDPFADKCFNGTAYANSIASTGYPADFAFDDIVDNTWVSAGTSVPSTVFWIAYKFQNPERIQRVRLHPRLGFSDRMLKNFSIEGSNNSTNGQDGTWTTLSSGLNVPDVNQWNNFDFESNVSYTWYRLSGTGTFLIDSYFACIGEIEMMERDPLADGLVGHWPFDGNAHDESGYSNHGYITGATLVEDKKNYADGAYSFNGVGNKIDCGSNSVLGMTQQITVSAWVKLAAMPVGQDRVVSKGIDNYVIYFENSTNPIAYLSGRVLSFDRSLDLNRWYHLAFTYNSQASGNNYKAYIDGQLTEEIAAGTGPIASDSHSLVFGNYWDSPTYGFNGSIDDVRIYNRALTSTEVAGLYANYDYDFLGGARIIQHQDGWDSGPTAYTTVGATFDPPQSTCENLVNRWFKFTATSPYIKLNVLKGSIGYIQYNLFKGSAYTPVACGVAETFERNDLTVGETYYLSIASDVPDRRGTFGLQLFNSKTLVMPSALTAEALASSNVALRWSDNSQDETGFQIDRSSIDSLHYVTIATTGLNITSFVDEDVVPDAKYYYRIRAIGTNAYSLYTPSVNVFTVDVLPMDTTFTEAIPKPFKLTREGTSLAQTEVRQFMLSTLHKNDEQEVFAAPPCLNGEYYAAFQLYYDLGDKETTKDWLAYLEVTLKHGDDSVWTKPLKVSMTTQTFISTVFHNELMSCDDNYSFVVTRKRTDGPVPQENIYLKILLFKKGDGVFNPALNVNLNCNYTSVEGKTTLSWSATNENIKEYDLEWVFIDSLDNYTASSAEAAFKFKEPVRVTVATPYYSHLTYYPGGTLWYRIRAIGINAEYPDHRINGKWCYSPCQRISIANHEPGRNWQEQTVFAEEGKYKKIMNYYDGSLRQRQAQTNLSTEEVTLVAESLYDYEGRKSVDILSVPATNANLKFKSGFNIFQSQDATVAANTSATSNKFHYDNRKLENSIINNVSGAGNYYSAANTHNTIHKDYIPDGEGYVFSQTEFVNDGTGRVSKQSGVGKEFRTDGNHATRYFYGNPTAEELIRLFGSNVGVASHYKKNLVVDPNGQVSVSYLDQEGRVIATALAGEKPDNVAALDSYTNLDTTKVSTSLNDKNRKDGGISITSHKLLNTSANTVYTFDYDLAAAASTIEGMGCVSCRYDLEISLTDPDGTLEDLSAVQGNESGGRKIYLRNDITAACPTPATAGVHFNVMLKEIGDYTITKKLIPHELTFEEMKSVVTQNAVVSAKMQDVVNSYAAVRNPSDCDVCMVPTCAAADSLINQAIDEVAAMDCENIYQKIVASIQEQHPEDDVYEPTTADIEQHELYCQYQLCIKDKDSDAFDKQLARPETWEAAQSKGYTTVSTLLYAFDPFFFKPELSGYSKKATMQGKLNKIDVAKVKDKTYRGPIERVVDPANTDFFINNEGDHDAAQGVHMLYIDLANKLGRGELTQEAYDIEVSKQRWALFKSFYLEAKRKTKLTIKEYKECPAAKAELERSDALKDIDTPEEIEAWGDENGGNDPISDIELATTYGLIRSTCNPPISVGDSIAINSHLEAYFNGNKKNMLRLIFRHQLTTDPHLVAIKNILTNYGCGLDSVAQIDPMTCKKEITIVIDNEIENGSFESPPEEEPVEEPAIARFSAKESSMAALDAEPCTSQNDYDALMALFTATNNVQNGGWINKTNWGQGGADNMSNWYGVITDEDGFVYTLSLYNNNLTGQLPVEIKNFCHLQNLYLNNNNLNGSIPDLPGNLEVLDVHDNQFSGSLPESINNLDSYYTYFNFRNNQLSGPVPAALSQAGDLTLSANKYTFSDVLDILLHFQYPGEGGISIDPQDLVDVRKTFSVPAGQSLELTTSIDRNTTLPCRFQWFKYVDGENDIPMNDLGVDGHTFLLNNFSAADTGRYYYVIKAAEYDPEVFDEYNVQEWKYYSYYGLVLTSRLQTVKLQTTGHSTTYNICIEYDENNPTIKTWTFKPDFNELVANCMKNAFKEDSILVEYAMEKLIEEEISEFNNTYRTQCLNGVTENLAYTYVPKEYHYTLYYFDQAGNLVQTVPPKGVKPLSDLVVKLFLAGTKREPQHELLTRYKFSSLNQVLWQQTPDAGVSRFWYNDKTQLKLSQNAQQRIDKNYSYSKYDEQGRIIEVGEMNTTEGIVSLAEKVNQISFPVSQAYTLSDVTKTHYDFGKASLQQSFKQQYLRTRVAYVELLQKGRTDTVATYYTYDIHGNVKSLVQHLPGLSDKRTDYVYDLISGKVNYVLYQYDNPDQFIHHYTYDADNRIQDVHTSSDAFIWDKDATYFYYLHGPLARVELGEYRVQGLDYYYSLQGWIKGVNMPYAADPGKDGYNGSVVGRDAFAYSLGYYQGDYKPLNNAAVLSDTRDQLWTRYNENMNNTGLYNGNISWMTTDLKKIGDVKGSRAKGMQAMVYQYDQLHRIVQSKSLTNYSPSTGFAARSGVSPYDEDYTYDPNGNIMTLKRHDDKAAVQDDFHYNYYDRTNRLRSVKPIDKDKVISGGEVITNNIVYRNVTIKGNAYVPAGKKVEIKALEKILLDPQFEARDGSDFWAHIVEDQGTYQYDAIGNLILNQDEGVNITWTPYGKVRDVHVKGDSLVLSYLYDATGNRVEKKIKIGQLETATRYLRDASGNVMTIYNDTMLIEQPIYGSSRLGIYQSGRNAGERMLGRKNYELSNHLDNVLSTISDNVSIVIDSAWTNVVSAQDYYSFGLEMNSRKYNDTIYCYGFNGKEKDASFGDGVYDYGFRIYSPKVARFLSVDPLFKSYPWNSTYSFAEGDPINFVDLDGKEKAKIDKSTKTLVIVVLGYAGGPGQIDPKNGNTQYKNALKQGTAGPKKGGLLSIENKIQGLNSNTQVVTYTSSRNNLNTVDDVESTIMDFNNQNPKGRVVAVGHSMGAVNLVDMVNRGNVKNVELLVTIDPASTSGVPGANWGYSYVQQDQREISQPGAKYALNYKLKGGIEMEYETEGFSGPIRYANGANYTLPREQGHDHSTIDDALMPNILEYIKDISNGNSGKVPFDRAAKVNYNKIPTRSE